MDLISYISQLQLILSVPDPRRNFEAEPHTASLTAQAHDKQFGSGTTKTPKEREVQIVPVDIASPSKMPVLSAPSGNPDAPQQYKQPSRKGKKAWRKNVDISEVQQGLEELNDQIIKGYA